ncbi:MAG: hypothetical protein H6740_21760 [Alphaproteobacteria bacterium]|nr:hypothetical protein [Alphaproteobacteria bacterium]
MLLLTLAALPAAFATVPDVFGHGPANIGIAGAATARADDPFAAYYNPAGLGQISFPTLSMGAIRGQASLQPFEGIVYDTNADGQLVDEFGAPDYGDVGTDYRIWDPENPNPYFTDGNMVAAAFPILNQWLRDQDSQILKNLRVTLGLAAYLPTQTTLRMQMQDPYVPYYVMFRNRNDMFTVHPSVGVHLFRGLYVGAGAQVMTDISARLRLSSYTVAESFPNEQGDDEISVVVSSSVEDMQLNVAPRSAPTFGFLFHPAELLGIDHESGPLGHLVEHSAFGLSYRGPWYSGTSADVLVYANGEVTFDDQTLLLSAMLDEPVGIELRDMVSLYNPPMLTLGFKTGYGFGPLERNGVDISLDLVRTEWSKFTETVSPYQEMKIDALTGASVSVLVGTDYGDPNFQDTWTPKVGVTWARCWTRCEGADMEKGLGMGTVLRGGYSFVPTPVPDQTGYTNYMDSDRHVFAGGLGVELLNRGVGPITIDVGGQYHSLTQRTVKKDASLVSDVDGDGALDFTRGYPLAGEITSAGSLWVVSAGVELVFGANPEARARKGDLEDDRHQPGIIPVNTERIGREITGQKPVQLERLPEPQPELAPDTPETEPPAEPESTPEETP